MRPRLSLQTFTSYHVAPDTSLQSKVGVVDIPGAAFDGLIKLGADGTAAIAYSRGKERRGTDTFGFS